MRPHCAARVLDFDDLVLFGHSLVAERDWVLSLVKARFPILAVDEYQDLGVPLHRIVKRLAFDGGVRLFAVGDADQSVYGFDGADSELLLELAEREDVETVRLQLNYRSAGRIVRASELALGESRGYVAHNADRQAVIRFIECPNGLGRTGSGHFRGDASGLKSARRSRSAPAPAVRSGRLLGPVTR
jgi:DNA helicase-2/ATP-dependent DNA helicase PcrA